MLDPLFLKELKELPRGRSFFLFRFIYLFGLLCLLAVIARNALIPEEIQSHIRVMAELSERLFYSLAVLQYVMLSIAASLIVSDAVARDIECGQLDLIRLTGLSERRIILGKLFSRLVHLFLVVASGIPIFVSLMILCDIGIGRLVHVECATLLVILLFSSMGMLASTTAESASRAILRAIVGVFLFNSLYFTWFASPHYYFIDALQRGAISSVSIAAAVLSVLLAVGLLKLAIVSLRREQREARQVVKPRNWHLLDEKISATDPDSETGKTNSEMPKKRKRRIRPEITKGIIVTLLVTTLAISAIISEATHFVFIAACYCSVFYAGYVAASNPLVGSSSSFRDFFLTTRLSVREMIKFSTTTERSALRDMAIILGSAALMHLPFHPISTIYAVLLAIFMIPFVLQLGTGISLTSRNTSAILQTYGVVVFTFLFPMIFQTNFFDIVVLYELFIATIAAGICLYLLFTGKSGRNSASLWALVFACCKTFMDSIFACFLPNVSPSNVYSSPVWQLTQAVLDGNEKLLFQTWDNLIPLLTHGLSAIVCTVLATMWLLKGFDRMTDRARPRLGESLTKSKKKVRRAPAGIQLKTKLKLTECLSVSSKDVPLRKRQSSTNT